MILRIPYKRKWLIMEENFGKDSKQEKEMAEDQDSKSPFSDTRHSWQYYKGWAHQGHVELRKTFCCCSVDSFSSSYYKILKYSPDNHLNMIFLWIIYHPMQGKRSIALNSHKVPICSELNDYFLKDKKLQNHKLIFE